MGANKTLDALKRLYYWPGMRATRATRPAKRPRRYLRRPRTAASTTAWRMTSFAAWMRAGLPDYMCRLQTALGRISCGSFTTRLRDVPARAL